MKLLLLLYALISIISAADDDTFVPYTVDTFDYEKPHITGGDHHIYLLHEDNEFSIYMRKLFREAVVLLS